MPNPVEEALRGPERALNMAMVCVRIAVGISWCFAAMVSGLGNELVYQASFPMKREASECTEAVREKPLDQDAQSRAKESARMLDLSHRLTQHAEMSALMYGYASLVVAVLLMVIGSRIKRARNEIGRLIDQRTSDE